MLSDSDLAELLEIFRPEAEGYLEQLRIGPPADEATRILHTLKGAAGTVGLMDVHAAAAALEERARAGTAPTPEDLVALEVLLAGQRTPQEPAQTGEDVPPEPGQPDLAPEAPGGRTDPDATDADERDDFLDEDAEMAAELRLIFTEEAEDNLEAIAAALIRLEENPQDPAALAEILRHTHTLKGAASMAGLPDVGKVAHRLEDAFADVKALNEPLTLERLDRLQAAVDVLGDMVERAAAGEDVRLEEGADPVARALAGEGEPEPGPAPEAAAVPAARRARLPGRFAASMGMKVPLALTPDVTGDPGDVPTSSEAAEVELEVDSITMERRRTDRRLEREVVRVELTRLDALQGTLGELVIGRNRDDLHVSDLKALSSDLISARDKLLEQIDYLRRTLAAGVEELSLRTAEEVLEELDEHRRRLVEFDTRLNGSLAQLERLIVTMLDDGEARRRTLREMESQLTSIRMVTVASLSARLRRPAREAARRYRKRVRLVVTGGDVGLDKSVVDQIADPMVHLVRNAVVHGIETPEERLRMGKDPTGHITIAATRKGGNILIAVSDDGAGIDLAKVRAAMTRAGMAPAAGGEEVADAIFRAGLTTLQAVGDIAGRGVGLDLVKARTEAVGGSVEVRTKINEGTSFVLRLPQTLMILPAMMVQVSGQQFALPLSSVRAVTRILPDEISTTSRGERIEFRRERIPLIRLERILGLRANEVPGMRLAVILEGETGPYAMLVDALLRREEIVAKRMGDLLAGLRVFAGATLTGDGKVCLILDAASLPKQRARKAARPQEEMHTPLILVVDDSSSIREAVKRIVASAGYRVQTAADGGEAWDVLRGGEVDLVLTDLEMPGVTGYDLLDRVRRSQRHRGLPVIVLSGLSSDENQRLAREKGAVEYMVKPVHRKLVLESVEKVLRRQGLDRALQR